MRFPVLNLFGDLGTLRVEGGAEVSALASGTGWGQGVGT